MLFHSNFRIFRFEFLKVVWQELKTPERSYLKYFNIVIGFTCFVFLFFVFCLFAIYQFLIRFFFLFFGGFSTIIWILKYSRGAFVNLSFLLVSSRSLLDR